MRALGRLSLGAVGVVLAALLAFATPGAAAGATSCTGALGAVTIDGDVSAGAGCDLSNTTVNGSVTVNPGGSLTIAPGSTTTITGNVTSTDATSVLIQLKAQDATTYTGDNVTIGGNVDVSGTTGTTAGIEPGNHHVVSVWCIAKVGGNVRINGTAYGEQSVHGTVNGNVTIEGGTAYAFVTNAVVGGNVFQLDHTGANAAGTLAVVAVFNDHVHGNVVIQDNSLTATGAGSDNVIEAIANNPTGFAFPPPPGAGIDGNLIVQDNTLTKAGASFDEAIDNPVGGNLLMQGNTVTGPAGSFVADQYVASNTVSGNLNLQDNTATGPASAIVQNFVLSNTVSQNLNCEGNTPAPTDDAPSPMPNTASKKLGQCSGL
jgi:hypothetical protein